MSQEADLEAFNNTFNHEPEKDPNMGLIGKGLIFTFFFWATFILVWFTFSFISEDGRYLRESIKETFSKDNLAEAKHQFGLVLGTESAWDSTSAITYLLDNQQTILKKINKGNILSTWSITPKDQESETKTYSSSTEFDIEKDIAYSSFTSLNEGSFQIINTNKQVLIRSTVNEKWSNYEDLYDKGFNTRYVSGINIAETFLNEWAINKYVLYKGTKKVDGKEHLLFSLNLDQNEYSQILHIYERSIPEEYFKTLVINFEIDPEKNTLEKIDITATNLFIGEKQFNIKKTFEYMKLSSNKDGLEGLIPQQSEILSKSEDFELADVLIDFFKVL